MKRTQNHIPRRIDRHAVQQGPRPGVPALASVEKFATGPTRKLMKCKQKLTFSTFNVRTLASISQTSELIDSAIKQKLDIICIQEHHISHDDSPIKHRNFDRKWTLVTSSATKNYINSTIGGVGILLSPQAFESLNSIE